MFSKIIAQLTVIRSLFCSSFYSLMLAVALIITSTAHAGQLTASVDRDSIGAKETLTLTLSAEGQVKTTPDFSGLKNDFEILSSQRSSSIQVINGRSESSTDWQLTLAPKRTGKLLIPSFNLGNEVSDAIEITVSQQSQQLQQTGDEEQVNTSIEIDKNTVYVQEQILVKIKLITQVDLSEAKMEPLDVKNALVVDLGRTQYQTNINGNPHLIVENKFAVFPQQSGELTLPSLSYDVVVEDMRSLWGNAFGRSRNNVVRLRTDPKTIEVKAIPGQYAGKIWQPATELSINETWSSSLDHLKIGEPITRTITINADALTAGQIAPLATDNIEGLTFYPDQAQTKDNKTTQGVQGTRVETMAIVPNRGGDFTLPAINIAWWNTKTQTMETASLPAKTIHVLGDPGSTQSSSLPKQNPAPAKEPASDSPPPVAESRAIGQWGFIVIGLLSLLATALTIYIVKLKKHIRQLYQDQDDRDNALLQKERDIWDALKATAATKDANALRKAVLNWAHWQWPEEKINTLDDIAKLGMREELTAELKALDELLYSNHGDAEWDAVNLLKLLNVYRKQRKSAKKSPELKNLYNQ